MDRVGEIWGAERNMAILKGLNTITSSPLQGVVATRKERATTLHEM
jgi:hypothetical protein